MTTRTSFAPFESDRTGSVTHPTPAQSAAGRPRCAFVLAALLWAAACLPSLEAQIYVANSGGSSSVTSYGSTANGNSSPSSTISGNNTGVNVPYAIAADATNLYVVNAGAGAGTVTIYGRSSNGNLAPGRSISGSNTGLSAPYGVAVDPSSIYVTNNNSNTVTIYPLGASGNAAPVATISGGNTGLTPTGIAVDASNLYVTNNATVTVYALSGVTSGTLNLTPSATITGASLSPTGIAVDSSHIYVANLDNSILVYALNANGAATPTATISGSNTGLNTPYGVAVDSSTIYVANSGNNTVTTYALSSVTSGTLNLAPTTTISGGSTSLNTPLGLAVALAIPAPVLTATVGSTAFTSGDDAPSIPVMVDGGLTVSSSESSLASSTVAITGNLQSSEDTLGFVNPSPGSAPFGNIAGSYNAATGVLTLTSAGATATPAKWQACLQLVYYVDSAITPNTASRTVSFAVNDGVQNSNTVTKTVTVTAVDQTPIVLTSGGSSSFSGSAVAVDNGVTVVDLDNTTLASGTVAITGAFHASEDVLAFTNTSASTYGNISPSYNAATGILTLTSASATATVAQWQAALRTVTYNDTASNPSTVSRTVSFAVSDGTKTSVAATKSVTVQGLYATTTTATAASATASSAAQSVSLSATVTSCGGTVNAGTVTFTLMNGSTPVGTPVTSGTVSGGSATASYTLPGGTAVGSYTIQAAYNAGGSFAASSTSGTSLSVNLDSTTTNASGTLSGQTTVSTFASGFNNPAGLAFDAAGNLYVANAAGGTISKVTPTGAVSTFVASGLSSPRGLAFDASGDLYVLNGGSNTVSKVTPGGEVSTFASGFNRPTCLAIDAAGNLYVANFDANTVSKVTPAGVVSTFVSSGLSGPYDLKLDTSGNLYVANFGTNTVSKFTISGLVTLSATVTSSAGTVNAGTVTFTLLNGSAVVGTPVTSGTVANGTATVKYALPFGTEASTYTINAVYNPGGTFGASSDSSHSLTPTNLQIIQIFFGGFSSTSGASDGSGMQVRAASASSSLAAVLNTDGTTGELVGYIASINSGFVVDITINADDTFSGQTKALTSSTGAGETLTFSGSIANGVITGTVAELSLPFSATVDPGAGSSGAIAGLYQAVGSGGATYAVIGTQGEVFALALTPSGVAAGTGTVAADNSFTVSTAQGVSVAGSVNPVTTDTTATITLPNGGGTIGVSGLDATTPAIHHLANLSTLQEVSGGKIISAGFVVTGSGSKRILVRAVGPGLSAFGVSGVLATPTLTLLDASRNTVVSNSGWAGDSTLAAAFNQVGAFSLATGSLDAAAIAVLQPGTYYLQVSGGGKSGQALAEIYDLDLNPSLSLSTLVNESSIGPVAGTSNILIAGFVIEGNSPQTVLIRGIGPGLSQFGVSGVLAAPSLSVFDSRQTLIAQNQAWGTPSAISGGQLPATASAISAAASGSGAFPLATGSNDSSVLVTLPPGAYTAQLSGVGSSSGTGLVEIYVVK